MPNVNLILVNAAADYYGSFFSPRFLPQIGYVGKWLFWKYYIVHNYMHFAHYDNIKIVNSVFQTKLL